MDLGTKHLILGEDQNAALPPDAILLVHKAVDNKGNSYVARIIFHAPPWSDEALPVLCLKEETGMTAGIWSWYLGDIKGDKIFLDWSSWYVTGMAAIVEEAKVVLPLPRPPKPP